jgi:ATP-dependent helicase/nuclease subunit A
MTPEGQEKAIRGHGHSMVVTAGAGTGKTHVLVQRYLALLREQGASIGEVLALTFTDKAAAEMRSRIREEAGVLSHLPRQVLEEELIVAPVMTFHSFCATVLREYPEKAGITPGFAVMDETGAAQVRADSFDRLMRGATSCEDSGALERVLACTPRTTLREILEALHGNRERSTTFFLQLGQNPQEIQEAWSAWSGREREMRLREAVRDPLVRTSLDRLVLLMERNTDRSDRAIATLHGARDDLLVLADPSSDLDGLAGAIKSVSGIQLTGGSALRWAGDDFPSYKQCMGTVRDTAKDLVPLQEMEVSPGSRHHETAGLYLQDLQVLFDAYCSALDSVKEQCGALDFDDLVRYARRLLESDGQVARDLSARYRFILVDEFQDTDPSQFGMILSILAAVKGRNNRLFIVGDPKQSIYLFRNADVTRFREAAEFITTEFEGRTVNLDTNFRSAPELVTFANAFFSRIFPPSTKPWEFEYQPVAACDMRRETTGGVEFLAVPEQEGMKSHDAESDAVARRIQVLAERERPIVWEPDGTGAMTGRPAGYGDIALLLARRTHLPAWTAALSRYGIPFHVHAGTGLFARQEVMDLASTLAFLCRPHDDMALLGALRSPFLGLPDDTLFLVSMAGGRTLWEKVREYAGHHPGDSRVSRIVRLLSRWLAYRGREPLTPFIRRILSESAVYMVYAALPDGPQMLANIEKVVHMTTEDTVLTRGQDLSVFSDGLARSIDEEERSGQGQPEDPMRDRVNIMTIHAAKGLEFPVVVVPECSRPGKHSSKPFMFGDEPAIAGVKAPDPDRNHEVHPTPVLAMLTRELHEKETAEYRRLLYVAFTRARDYLVVSGTVKPDSREKAASGSSGTDFLLSLLYSQGADPAGGCVPVKAPDGSMVGVRFITDPGIFTAEKRCRSPGQVIIPDNVPDSPAGVALAAAPSGPGPLTRISVSKIEDTCLKKRETGVPPDILTRSVLINLLDSPETTFGTAVHEIFEGRDAAEVCRRHGLPDTDAARIDGYYRCFLQHSLIRDAIRVFTEFPVVAMFSGVQVSGVIDRLQVMPDGSLVVIDFKTGAGDEEDADLIRRYRVSISTYCHAVSQMTRKAVSGWVYRVERDRLVPFPVLPHHDLEPLVAAAVTALQEEDRIPLREEGEAQQSPGEYSG